MWEVYWKRTTPEEMNTIRKVTRQKDDTQKETARTHALRGVHHPLGTYLKRSGE